MLITGGFVDNFLLKNVKRDKNVWISHLKLLPLQTQ